MRAHDRRDDPRRPSPMPEKNLDLGYYYEVMGARP
jgi:hypothetical protein